MDDRRYKKSQALVEMAILAPLVLMTLGFLVTYICKLNNDQYALMQSFRNSLHKSHLENQMSSYGTWDDRRMASVEEPILGMKTPSSGAGYTMWAIPDVTDEGEDPAQGIWVKINRLPSVNVTQAGSGSIEPGSGSIEPRYFTWTTSTVTANNNNGNIRTGRTGAVAEGMLYKVGSDQNGMVIPYGRGHGG